MKIDDLLDQELVLNHSCKSMPGAFGIAESRIDYLTEVIGAAIKETTKHSEGVEYVLSDFRHLTPAEKLFCVYSLGKIAGGIMMLKQIRDFL